MVNGLYVRLGLLIKGQVLCNGASEQDGSQGQDVEVEAKAGGHTKLETKERGIENERSER